MDQGAPVYEGTVVGSTKDGRCYFIRVDNHQDCWDKDVFLPGSVVTGDRRQLPVSTTVRFQVKDGAKGPEAVWAEILTIGSTNIRKYLLDFKNAYIFTDLPMGMGECTMTVYYKNDCSTHSNDGLN